MAGRKRHTPEQIIRKLRQGDELAATGADVEEIVRQLDVSVPTLYNWRKQYGGMNRAGFDAASVFVKDADHAQALPARAT